MSKIEWTDITANPITVATGGHWCKKISPGCANCYAEAINTGNRFDFASGLAYSGDAPEMKLDREMLAKWSRMRTNKKIFVCSMTDWCGEWIPLEWRLEMLDAMAKAPNQIFQLLTKRPEILLETINAFSKTLPNLWLGVSVENQKTADERIPLLLKTPAKIRFLICEPLLEKIEVYQYLTSPFRYEIRPRGFAPFEIIDQVIVGAESGKNARPMDESWVRDLLRQCEGAEIAFFYKQNFVEGKKVSLPKLDGKVWAEMPRI